MLPFAGRNIGLPRKLKGPRHVFHLHNCIRGVTCSSHTNELMTKDEKETRGFTWTWRWMFLLQSLYPLNWLLVYFHSVSFSLLVYLRWVLPQKESAFLYPIYTPFPICSCTEDTAGAFKTPQIGPFNSLQFRYVCHDLSVWKQAAKITLARWKCATFQIIIYQAEEKNLIFRTSRILAWGKSRVGQPPYFITVRTR